MSCSEMGGGGEVSTNDVITMPWHKDSTQSVLFVDIMFTKKIWTQTVGDLEMLKVFPEPSNKYDGHAAEVTRCPLNWLSDL